MPSGNPKGYVTVGRFSDPYGVTGGIRLKALTEAPSNLKRYKAFFSAPGETCKVSFGKALKDGFVVEIEGVESPEAAKAWKGKNLLVARDDLPKADDNQFYYADLEGLTVVTAEGKTLGLVTAVGNFGAGDLIEVALDKPRKGVGKTLMLPFRNGVVLEVELEKRTITVDADGWLED